MTLRRLRRVLAALAALLLSLACSGGSAPNEPSDDFSGDSSSGGGLVGSGGASGGTASGGSASGGAGTGGQGVGGTPIGCAGTDITFTFDDAFKEYNVEAEGTPTSVSFRTALPMAAVPNFTVAILGIDGTAVSTSLADGPRIDWSLASNGSDLPSAIVSTMPSGENQLAGDFSGTLLLVTQVEEVGALRCGTLELSLSYLDEDEQPHTFSAEGWFQMELTASEMP